MEHNRACSLVVLWLGLSSAFIAAGPVQSLVWELKSHIKLLLAEAKKKKKMNGAQQNSIFTRQGCRPPCLTPILTLSTPYCLSLDLENEG